MKKPPEYEIGTFFRRSYVDLLNGDVLAALMLSQIVYWYIPDENKNSRLRVSKEIKGETTWWIAKSYQDWSKELGLTYEQSRRCISVLEKRGIITTAVHKFNNSPTVHIRLCVVKGRHYIKLPEEVYLGLKPSPIPICGVAHINNGLNTYQPVLQHKSLTDTTSEITSDTQTQVVTLPKTCIGENIEKHDVDILHSIKKKEEGKMNAKDIVEKQKIDKQNILEKKPTLSLEAHWRNRISLLNGGKYQKPFTAKQRGQLKHLNNYLGADTKRVVDWCLQNWSKFASMSAIAKGQFSPPTEPDIGFLLQHHEWAMQHLQAVEENQAASKVALNTLPLKPTAPPTNPPEPAYIPTSSELSAFLEELEGLKKGKQSQIGY